MAETIESFVSKLQADGVEAGRQEADRIRDEARKEAEKIVADAREQAEEIVADAKAQAGKEQERSRTELRLAARDAMGRLRSTLSEAIRGVLATAAESTLGDVEFIQGLVRDLVLQYAKSDTGETEEINVHLSKEACEKLADAAIRDLREAGDKAGARLNLHATLERAGFEYRVDDATVEVTVESVVELLSEMVSPRLREIVRAAAEQNADDAQAGESESPEGGEES